MEDELIITPCPCGKGEINEYIDRTPGFREHVAYICCKNCNKKYVLRKDVKTSRFYPILKEDL